MSDESSETGGGKGWRDFLNRREPGARWVLLLLVVAGLVEGWVIFVMQGNSYSGPRRVHYIALALIVAALGTNRWWSLPSSPAFPETKWKIPRAAQRWVRVMLAAVTALAIWPRTERMKHSFSGDELQQLNWAYQGARNSGIGDVGMPSHLYSDHLAAYFAVEVMGQNPYGEKPPGERAGRTLPWVAGVFAAGMVVVLAAAMGSPRAGLAAGLILALHPLAVQWSSEVTDFSVRMLAMGAVLFSLIQALHTNRWRWWLLLSAALALFMAGSFGTMLEPAVLLGVTALVLRTSRVESRTAVSSGLRMLAAVALAGVAVMIPMDLILKPFGADPTYTDEWGRLLSGVPYAQRVAEEITSGASLQDMTQEAVWRWPVLWVVMPLAGVAGLYFMIRQDWRTRLVAGMFLYGLWAFPGNGTAVLLLPVVLVWGGVGLMQLFPGQRRFVHAPLFLAVVCVMGRAPALQRTISVPREPLKDALAVTQKKDARVAGFGRTFSEYLARAEGVRELRNTADLSALVDVAYEKELPLFVVYSLADRDRYAAVVRELEESGRFVVAGEFMAFDPREAIRVCRYRPREQIYNIELKKEKAEEK